MNTLEDIAQEAADIFKGYDLVPLHWVVKKGSQASVGASSVSVSVDNADELRESLVFDEDGSTFDYAVWHVVIEFTDIKNRKQHRFHPNVYGGVS